jgi:hypothetical protein
MQELIDGELIVVKDPPRVSQMCVNGVAGRTIFIFWLGVMPIKQVQQKFVSGDLKSRNEIAPAGPHLSQDGVCFGPSGSGGPMGGAFGAVDDVGPTTEIGSCAKPAPGATRAKTSAAMKTLDRPSFNALTHCQDNGSIMGMIGTDRALVICKKFSCLLVLRANVGLRVRCARSAP